VPHKSNSTQFIEEKEQTLSIVWPITLIGGAIGLLLSWSVLSGDQSGRVNLLYLLLVYLVIPIISVVASISSMLFGRGINLAKVLTLLPFWSYQIKSLLRKLQQLNIDKYWFLMQSQIAAVAFSLMSLVTFLLLLLVTDVNFVWRSTVLSAQDILPWLELIAKPWFFWSSAQPDLELLQLTKDSRLVTTSVEGHVYASWWQFILATQILYSVLLRLGLFIIFRKVIKNSMQADIENQLLSQIPRKSLEPVETLQESCFVTQLPQSIAVTNWANIPEALFTLLPMLNVDKDNLIIAGPQATQAQQTIAERWQNEQLVIVKSWEPPLAELEDYLQNGKGFLFPIDWLEIENEQYSLVKPKQNHLNEWLRVIANLPQWQVYMPGDLT
jgi:hypothetical protein